MTAKEYLSQAFIVDVDIGSKLDQLDRLNALAMKATTTFSEVPFSGTPDPHRREDIILKIIELEDRIKDEMRRLVDLKSEIMTSVAGIEEPEQRIVLEKRYLEFKKWEDIAAEMNRSLRSVYRLHGEALKKVCVS
jgi:DNA-directed RNA polymerase specialized sigma subunit